MIKILKNLIVGLFIVLSIIYMITETENVINGVKIAISLWSTKVFPVLFPFYIVSSLAIHYGVAHFFGETLRPVTSFFFKTSSISGFIFVMSILSGNPSSAIMISRLHAKGEISPEEAQHLLSFCVFTNPLFIIGTIGYGYFQNLSIGYIILISHIGANILIGILMRTKIKTQDRAYFSLKIAYQKMEYQSQKEKRTFGEVLTEILQGGTSTMFLIAGFMIFYNIVIVMIKSSGIINNSYLYLHFIFNLLNINYDTYQVFFLGIFEMVLGIDNVVKSNFPLRLAATYITILLSFGGLSIHSQIQSLLLKMKIKYFPFLISRIAQAVFSGVITYTIFPLLFKEKTINTGSFTFQSKPLVLTTIIILVLTLIFMIMYRRYNDKFQNNN